MPKTPDAAETTAALCEELRRTPETVSLLLATEMSQALAAELRTTPRGNQEEDKAAERAMRHANDVVRAAHAAELGVEPWEAPGQPLVALGRIEFDDWGHPTTVDRFETSLVVGEVTDPDAMKWQASGGMCGVGEAHASTFYRLMTCGHYLFYHDQDGFDNEISVCTKCREGL